MYCYTSSDIQRMFQERYKANVHSGLCKSLCQGSDSAEGTFSQADGNKVPKENILTWLFATLSPTGLNGSEVSRDSVTYIPANALIRCD